MLRVLFVSGAQKLEYLIVKTDNGAQMLPAAQMIKPLVNLRQVANGP
jgi:hypothetical protein